MPIRLGTNTMSLSCHSFYGKGEWHKTGSAKQVPLVPPSNDSHNIITENGTQRAWEGECDPYQPTYYQWLRQGWPTKAAWSEWRSFLWKGLGCVKERRVHQRLGRWLDEDRDKWHWWYSLSDKGLYEKSNNWWIFYFPIRRRRRNIQNSLFNIG